MQQDTVWFVLGSQSSRTNRINIIKENKIPYWHILVTALCKQTELHIISALKSVKSSSDHVSLRYWVEVISSRVFYEENL